MNHGDFDYFYFCRDCGKVIHKKGTADIKRGTTGQCIICSHKGKNNPNWNGENICLRSLHQYIQRHKPRIKQCEICGKEKKLELSLTGKKYTRNILNYRWLCRKCHNHYDESKRHRNKMGKFTIVKDDV